MRCRLTLCPLVGAVLAAQPPADFEASVKAAMAPSIAQQRAAVQKQASAVVKAGAKQGAPSSFFTTSFFTKGVADCDPLPAEQLDPLIEEAAQKAASGSAIGASGD